MKCIDCGYESETKEFVHKASSFVEHTPEQALEFGAVGTGNTGCWCPKCGRSYALKDDGTLEEV